MRPLTSLRAFALAGAATFLVACAGAPLTPGIFLDQPRPGDTAVVGPLRDINTDGYDLTKLSEGFKPRLYLDAASYCSIAYGHLVVRRPCDGSEPENFRDGLTQPEGETLLVTDMTLARRSVILTLRDPSALNDDQFAALCDFVYNVGGDHFRTSTLRQVIDQGRLSEVPVQMRRWIWAGAMPVDGLVTRRKREIALFFKGQTIPVPRPGDQAPTPIDITQGEQ
jgi:lysozyme